MTAPAKMPSEPPRDIEWRSMTSAWREYIDLLRTHTESLQAECERLRDALDMATQGKYSQLMLDLANGVSEQRADRFARLEAERKLAEKDAEIERLRDSVKYLELFDGNSTALAERAAKESAESRNLALVAALRGLLGGPELADEKIGWLGGTASTPNHFQCEFCRAENLDCTLIEHTSICPIPKAREALKGTK